MFSSMQLNPPISTPLEVSQTLKSQGFCLLESSTLAQLTDLSMTELFGFGEYWNHLFEDQFLKDHGKYRLRRHSSYVVENRVSSLVPHRPHWQSLDFNALHGGIVRHFEPIDESLNLNPSWLKLIGEISKLFTAISSTGPWFTEAHQFRITTAGGIGRPTPEGAHRDGVDFIAIVLIKRHAIKGGETRLFNLNGHDGIRFTLDQPWSVLLLDDHKIIHETTPIQGLNQEGYRDTLVLTYRQHGFQGS